MAYTPVNPYLSLAELREELKMKTTDVVAGSSTEDDLLRAIDNASRWVDDYTQRDYFFHDFTVTPMEFDDHDEGVYGAKIFPRFTPIIDITEIKVAGVALAASDFTVKNVKPDEQQIISLIGDWSPRRPDRLVQIKGRFGYLQASSYPVTEAGDALNQLSNWKIQNPNGLTLRWLLQNFGGQARVWLFSDAALTNQVAAGLGAFTSTVALTQENNSGISGTVDVVYSADDIDAANILTPQSPVTSSSVVPSGLPGKIKLATRQVAAAISGRNRKEIVGLDGTKESIIESEIPSSVFKMLGRRAPILI